MKKSELKQLIREILDEDFALGYSHGMVFDDPQPKGWRDPLNDPILTGKINESDVYRFKDFDWLANLGGFGKPSDVYYKNIHLGIIESSPGGYIITNVSGPLQHYDVKLNKKNKFKTKNDAALSLHLLWKLIRNEQ